MMAPYVMAAQYGNLQNAATIQAAYAQYGMPMACAPRGTSIRQK